MKQKFENTLPVGTVLEGKAYRYEIVKVLGQGSFGITYLASIKMRGDLGAVDAFVAIKEFFMSDINGRDHTAVTSSNKDGLFDKYKKKFIKEAQSLGKLKHPNIVKVIESFEANNTVYYAMAFVEGGSLDDYIGQKECLSEEETIRIANQILDALGYMHFRKMLHLDLKPSNVMLNHGSPVLIDFGLSKQYDDRGNPESSTTIGAGTPGYAPLEQSNYKGQSDDAAGLPVTMDLYAFGATMFKMLTGQRPPIASDILNLGFPEDKLIAMNVSPALRGLIKDLMNPLHKDRPQSAQAVKSRLDGLGTDKDDDTTVTDEVQVVEVSTPPEPVQPKGKPDDGGKNTNVWKWLTPLLIGVICVGVAIMAGRGCGRATPIELNDDTVIVDTAEVIEETPVVVGHVPEINYYITGNDEYGSSKSQLCATIDGEKVVIGSISYMFGPDNMGNMNLFAQEDFDGDGVKDAVVYDANMGSGGGSTWTFVTYDGDNSFSKSRLFSEASYYEPVISTVNGQKVLDFVLEDMGERIVKERHGLKNGNLVSLDLPKSKTQAYTPLTSIDMDELGEDGYFFFDLNGDGVKEKITTTGSYHFGRMFVFTMNGREYEFNVENALWGGGILHVLKSKTNGMHDLMTEQETRLVHKWNGSTYSFE